MTPGLSSKHRSKPQILISILNAISTESDGAIISAITRKANLCHHVVVQYTKFMIAAGLVTAICQRQERSGWLTSSYRLTQTGHDLKVRLESLSEDLKNMNLHIL